MSKCIFITATDTEQGKTTVSVRLLKALVAEGVSASGFKPVAAGATYVVNHTGQRELQNEDAQQLLAASFRDFDYKLVNPQCFEAAVAPHLAATSNIDFDAIDRGLQVIAGQSEVVLIEGAGGWLLPTALSEDAAFKTLADWVQARGLPVILVVGMRLGCLNHALLTVESIQRRGLELVGWVANQATPEVMPELAGNLETLRTLIDAPYLGFVPYSGAPANVQEQPDGSVWEESEPFRTWLARFKG